MPKEGAVGDATVDIDTVKSYKDDELDTKGADRGDEVGDTTVVDDDDDKKVEKEVETKAEDEPKAEDKVEETDEEDEDKPRDRKGRFLKSPMVPKARLDEVLRAKEESDSALRELTTLIESEFGDRRGKEDAPDEVQTLEAEIVEFEKARAKALKDGDEERITQFSAAIRQRERQIARMEAAALSDAARERAREEFRTDQVVAQIEAMFPALNPDEPESYDEDLAIEVRTLRDGLLKSGMRLSEATAKAVNYVMRGIEPKKEAPAAKGVDTKARGLKDKVEAAKKQPGNLGKAALGADHDKAGGDLKTVDVTKLSDKEFEALPESTIARLRGDLM